MSRRLVWALGCAAVALLVGTLLITDAGGGAAALALMILAGGVSALAAILRRLNTREGQRRRWANWLVVVGFAIGIAIAEQSPAAGGVLVGILGGLIAGMAWNSPKLRD